VKARHFEVIDMSEKDYSLLRKFDLDAAKRGEAICMMSRRNARFVAHVPECQIDRRVLVIAEGASNVNAYCDDGCYIIKDPGAPEALRMAPLAWVEGKPVYPGDVLYWLNAYNPGATFVVGDRVLDSGTIAGVSTMHDGTTRGEGGDSGMRPENLTWTAPKVKRHGWVNVHRKTGGVPAHCAFVSHAYSTKELADMYEENHGPRLACIRIEWEEPA
jgi:hypothetical protein